MEGHPSGSIAPSVFFHTAVPLEREQGTTVGSVGQGAARKAVMRAFFAAHREQTAL